jgi:predicted metal-dependent peptidase
MTVKLTPEQRIQKQHVWLMNNMKYCQYSGIFMLGRTEVSDTMPTAATDGFNVVYGSKFVENLRDEELRGLILHENLHKAFRHLSIWKHLYKKDARKANKACDYVINLMIYDSDPEGTDVALPEGGLLDEQYRGMDASEVFRKLQEKSQDSNGEGDGDGTASGSGDEGAQGPQGFDEHDWESGESLSESERQEIQREIDQALRQGAIHAGKLKGELSREISSMLEPKVNWREVLRDFVNSVCANKDNSTWRRPNRRWVDQDVYMPSMIGESMGRMVVAIDTSGSIGSDELSQFLGEVMSIARDLQPEAVDLLYWDTAVAQHEVYDVDSYESMLQSTKPKGGGGTSVLCVPRYMSSKNIKPECVLVLTDGHLYDGWGEWDCPVFWGITSKNIVADVGVSVYVG